MVDWMLKNEKMISREEAVKLCQKLLDLNLMQHVSERQPFADDKLVFFEFRVTHFICISLVVERNLSIDAIPDSQRN